MKTIYSIRTYQNPKNRSLFPHLSILASFVHFPKRRASTLKFYFQTKIIFNSQMASSPALDSFMKNLLQVRKYQIQIVADNAKLPQVNSEHSLVQEYLSPAARKRKILTRPLQDRWGDLVDDQDYILSSVVIGQGAVAMKPQDSVNLYLLETDLEEKAATTLVTLPEDESVHTYDDKATSWQKHKK
jgi:hypothetical protein